MHVQTNVNENHMPKNRVHASKDECSMSLSSLFNHFTIIRVKIFFYIEVEFMSFTSFSVSSGPMKLCMPNLFKCSLSLFFYAEASFNFPMKSCKYNDSSSFLKKILFTSSWSDNLQQTPTTTLPSLICSIVLTHKLWTIQHRSPRHPSMYFCYSFSLSS